MPLSTTLARLLAGLGLLGAVVLAPWEAQAQEDEEGHPRCYVSGSFGMNFRMVNRAGGEAISEVDIRCQAAGQPTYFTVCVFLGAGHSNQIDPRLMTDYNDHELEYDLFYDPNHQHMLDIPTDLDSDDASLHQVQGFASGYQTVPIPAPIYGLVYPGQTVPPGNYQEQYHSGLIRYFWSHTSYPETTNCTTATGGDPGGLDLINSGGVTAEFEDSCIISASDLDFGQVDTLGQLVLQTSSIRVDCPVGKEWSLGLDNGQNHDASGTRRMKSGDHYVSYGLYIDPNHNDAWGNANPDDRYAGVTDDSASPVEVTVYGKVPEQDDVPPGRYTDTVIATLYY